MTAGQTAKSLSPADEVVEDTWSEMRRLRRRSMVACGVAVMFFVLAGYLLG